MLGRVRRLLALAQSPNVHEAAAAAAAAQALIARHRLEGVLADEVAEPVGDGRDAPLEVALRPRRWKAFLAAGLARVNGCIAYSVERPDGTALCLVGRDADRDAVAAVWSWLVQRIELLSATHGAGQPRRWHDAFRVGAAETVVARLAATEREARTGLSEAALVRVEPALAERAAAVEAYAARTLHLTRGRGLRVDADALDAGRSAGATLPLRGDRR